MSRLHQSTQYQKHSRSKNGLKGKKKPPAFAACPDALAGVRQARGRIRPTVLVLALLLAGTPASASIVNIEGLRGARVEDGLSGRLELSIRGSRGNTDKSRVSTGVRLERRSARTTDLALAEYAYGESGGARDTNRAFVHLRRTVQVWARYAPEAFVQAERNEFTRLSFRGLAGGGVRATLLDASHWGAWLGLGAMYVRETLEEREGTTDAGTTHFWRASTYLSVNGDLNDYTRVYNTVYYQPAIDHPADYRLLDEAGLLVRLTERIDLRVSVQVAHQSRPPQAVDRTDVDFTTGIEYRF